MHKKTIIRHFLQTLNRQFQQDQELSISFVYRGWINTAPYEQMGADCSTVTTESTDESINYVAELGIFFYIGEVPGKDFGGNKTTFVFTEKLEVLLPESLKAHLKEVAATQKAIVIRLKTDERLLLTK